MFERFTDEARAIVVQAHLEARAVGCGHIGTEHLLLGAAVERGLASRLLAKAGITGDELRDRLPGRLSGIDADALAAIGIDLEAVRARTEEAFGPGALEHRRATTDGRMPFTPQAKRAFEFSLREAQALQHDHIGTEHVLLGLARGDEPALTAHGLTYERVRALVLDELAA